jgi:hypothetical protein
MGGVGDFSVTSRSFLYIFHLDVPWPDSPVSLSRSRSLCFISLQELSIFLIAHPPTNDTAADERPYKTKLIITRKADVDSENRVACWRVTNVSEKIFCNLLHGRRFQKKTKLLIFTPVRTSDRA